MMDGRDPDAIAAKKNADLKILWIAGQHPNF
jgi:hypothetical protein